MIAVNRRLAESLDHLGRLLQLAGADRFRVRAYAQAARSVADADYDVVADYRGSDAPRKLPAVGPGIARLIHQYAEEGALPGLEDLEREYPPSLLELLRVPRLNRKRVELLRTALGVRSLADLRLAARDHRLAGVKGLGPRVEAEVLAALNVHADSMPHRRADVLPVAAEVLHLLQELPGVGQALAAGGLRRKLDLLPSLDFLLVTAKDARPEDVAASASEWGRVEPRTDHSFRLLRDDGIAVHVGLADEKHLGRRLLTETGSASHLQQLARRPRNGKAGAGNSEEAFYASLGLDYIEPELREGRGEIAAAAAHRLPRLVRVEDLRGDLHSHTDRTDGRDSLEDMVEAARSRGLSYLAVTDHTQSLKITGGQDPRRLREQMEAIDRLNGTLRGFRILKSAEVDILEDGRLDLPDDLLRDLDLTVCSVHSHFTLPPATQTERVLRAMEHPSFRILGHPTGRLLLRRQGHPLDLSRVIRAARDLGRVLEVNGQPDRLDLDDRACRDAKEAGVKIAISSDAHSTRELAYAAWGVDQARRGWIEPADVINTLPLPEFLDFLKRARG